MTLNSLKTMAALMSLCLLFTLTTTAQVNINPTPDNRTWQEMMQDPNTSFYATQSKFNEYWSNREVTRGSGFKAFKRWEWFMEPRVNERGVWPMPDAVQRAIASQPEMFATGTGAAWSYIGNTSVPTGGGGAGRINSIRELPGSTTTFFACAPAGGLWKTTNSGTSWAVVGTDFLGSIGVSDVAIDPSATNTMYIATGDGDAGDTYSIGVMKTIDGGTTWTSTGLTWSETQTRTMSRIMIHPANTQIVLCATSNGVYRSTDGGTTWTQTVAGNFKDLAMKPGDPNTWYACTNQLYRSIDGGVTWTAVTSGLPTSASSQRMALSVSANNSAVVYILASGTDSGLLGVYKSSDSGVSFTQMTGNSPNYLNWDTSATATTGGQGWYDLRIAADPSNANTIFIGGVNVWKSINGGSTYTLAGHWYGGGGAAYVHADIHALYFVPNSTRLLVGCDGGVFTSTNGGTAFTDISSNLAIAQIYRLSVANTNSNLVISGWQDNGTNLKNGTTHTRPLGGDGMDCQIDPSNANTMYGEIYYGSISKSTNGGGAWTNIVASGGANEDENGAWVTPYVLGPNPNHLYVGKSLVFKSLDGGVTFTGSAAFGGTADCNYIAVAPSNTNIVLASKGSSLFKSIDNAATFTQLTGLQGSYIGGFAFHNTDPNKIWVCFSNYTDGAKVYYSSNGGSTWTNISGNLPNIPANTIAFQPGANNGVYVGMDAGVFYRDDVLGSWVPYMNALPRTPVTDLDVHINTSTITASTYGRGIWRAPLYTLPGLDAAMNGVIAPVGSYCTTSVTPQIQILNAGTSTLTSMVISYSINGTAQPNYNWTGSLSTGGTVNISLPTVNNGAGAFSFQVTIASANGVSDEISGNNSSSTSYYCINGTNTATLTLETDCYASETSWNITDSNGNVVHSGSGYNNETTYQIPLCLSNGCYTFNIFDGYGDGITGSGCTQGAGNYFLTDNATGSLHFTMTNAAYGTGTSHSFCYPLAPISGCTQVGACNYNAAATLDNGSCTFGPVNDLCSGAALLTVNAAATSTTNVGTCQEGTNPSCGGTTAMKDVWFKFVYQGGPVTITTNFTGGTLSDTRLAVYTACGGTQLACNDDISSTNYKSSITLACGALTFGNTYYIQAGGYNATTGTFSIQVTAPIEICNNLDDDCDGVIDEGFDTDLDGFTSCGGDCNDNNPNIRPNATETCNGIDDNCNGSTDEGVLTTFYRDADSDGYGNASLTTQACTAPAGYVSNSTDCNDSNANVRPNATETCNGIDDNCNGSTDEGLLSTFYTDADGDGYGNAASSTQACFAPAGYVSNSTDCNDSNANVRPNATETCNGIDDNCNGSTDEGVLTTFYRDADSDGYGNASLTTQACTAPAGYVSNSTDCNDSNANVRPNATETCNGFDDNCNGSTDEGVLTTFYRDADSDGYGNASLTTQACTAPAGYVSNSNDCNDSNANVRPNATETCNGIDDNCNGSSDEGVLTTFYRDADSDGYGNASLTTQACTTPVGYVSNSIDCNDSNANVRPNATETCNGIDDNCNGSTDEGVLTTFYRDADSDGYGNASLTTQACTAPVGYVSNSTDCNDSNANVRPNATETCNGIDDNCNGSTDEGVLSTFYRDADSDGYGNASLTTQACTAPAGYVSNSNDCNDSNANVRPNATEICTNTIDDNCNGQINENCCALNLSTTVIASSCTTSSNGSIDLSITGGTSPYTYAWSNGATTQDITNVPPGNYSVNVTDANGCSASISATVSNLGQTSPPTPTEITGPNGVCRNSTGNIFTVTPVAGASSYLWTLPTGATGSSTSNTITLSFSSTYNTGNLCVRAVNACGTSTSFCRSVAAYTTAPTTPGGISGPTVDVCAGTTQTYSISPVANATSYTWTAPTGASIASGQGTTTVTVSFSSTFGANGVLSVKSVNCFGSSANRTATIYKVPGTPSTISGQSTSVCPGSTQTYSIAAVVGATSYVWTAPTNASITAGQGTTTVTVSFNGSFASGTLSVVAASACGQSTARTLSLTKTPTVSVISGNSTNLCGGGLFTYSVTAVTGAASYNWTVPAGCSIATNNGNSIVMNVPSTFTTGTLTLVVTNTCGVSVTKTLALTAIPASPVSITGTTSVCPNQTGLVYTTPTVAGVTQLWTLPTGGVITSGQGTTSMTCTWGAVAGSVTVRSVNACGQSGTRGLAVSLLTCMQGEGAGDATTTKWTESSELKVYPNPSQGSVTVVTNHPGTYRCIDISGKILFTHVVSEGTNTNWQLNDLAEGIYLIDFLDNFGTRKENQRITIIK